MFRINELIGATKGRLISGSGNAAIRGISTDTRSILPKDAFIAIKGDNFDGHDFIDEAIKKGAIAVIVTKSPPQAGPPSAEPSHQVRSQKKVAVIEVSDTVKALGDIAGFHRKRFAIPVIAVTGSNGKTTTKEMIAHLLSARFSVLKNEGTKNNHIGLPATLLNLNSSYDIVVLEVGTNHFGEVDYLGGICRPNIGVITNIGPSHLEYLFDLSGVLKEKYKLIGSLAAPHIGVLNADDILLKDKLPSRQGKAFILGYGIKNKCDFRASCVTLSNDRMEFCVNQKYKFTLKSPGRYNIYNALAAAAVARIFGISYKEIILRLNTFDFPKGRLKPLKINNIKFIDDTYNSNPLSLKEALDALANYKTSGRKIFIMGDMLELGSHKKTFHLEAGRKAVHCCDIFITVGGLSRLAASAAGACGFDEKNIFACETASQARDVLFNELYPKEGDVVLVKGSRLLKMEEILKG